MSRKLTGRVGVVVIGRNEGERLRRCLGSVADVDEPVVYVDSGSADGSVQFARSVGVEVVELDMTQRFTMARGRNAGYHRLVKLAPDTEFVQFVDGDCEVADGWIGAARQVLLTRPEIWVVCGRRRERFPEASLYNRLADIEWDTPAGVVAACGGDAMMKVEALTRLDGFNETMIAGEEPELCARVRLAGGQILRIDQSMTCHDAAIMRFGQWWSRARRGGFAYAHGAALHAASAVRHNLRRLLSVVLWTVVLPIAFCTAVVFAIMLSSWFWGLAGLVVAWHVLFFIRAYRRIRRGPLKGRDIPCATGLAYLCKWAELLGVMGYVCSRFSSTAPSLIEYKTVEEPAASADETG